MEQHQNYTRDVLENQEEALSKIVARVPRGAVVLDIGCGSGMMGRFLTKHNECVVDGVDLDPQAVEMARPKYRKVGVFDLERDSLLTAFSPEAYDCIVMADVIEHIVHPEQLFDDVKKLLKPGGLLLFSIPNITHISSGLELVLGKFGYQNSGLLDSTHVRFYSRDSFVAKLASCGIYVDQIDTVKRDVTDTEFQGFKLFPKKWVREIIEYREDALTYQWIMTARLFNSQTVIRNAFPIPGISQKYLSVKSRLYWRGVFEKEFIEENSIPGQVALDVNGVHNLVFDFSETNCHYPVVDIRIDPVSEMDNFVFKDAALISSLHQTLWATRELDESNFSNANIFSANFVEGYAVIPTTADPQWHLKLNPTVLASISPGCKFHLGINLSPDAICGVVVAALDDKNTKQVVDENKYREKILASESQIADLTAAASEVNHKLNNTIGELAEKLTVREQEITSLQMSIESQRIETRTTTANLSAQLESILAEARLAQLELTALTERFEDVESKLSDAQKRTSLMLGTLSWRVTKPLRWLRRWFS